MNNDNAGKSRKTLWVKLAMNYFDDPKFTHVSPLAELLYVRSVAFAKQDNTGFIAYRAVARIASDLGDGDALTAELVESGLWAVEDFGWTITNWSDWQEDAAKVDAKREQGLIALHKRHSVDAPARKCALCVEAGWVSDRSPDRSPASTLPQERETESEREKEITLEQNTVRHDPVTEGFDEFYEAYPRKVGKEAARKAWRSTAKKRPALEAVLSALEQAKRGWSDPKYIPHPATWLNQGRWDDEQGSGQMTAVGASSEADAAVTRLSVLWHTGASREAAVEAVERFPEEARRVALAWWDDRESLTG